VSLFRIAQEVTDNVLGKGTYKRINGFDPSADETRAFQKPEPSKRSKPLTPRADLQHAKKQKEK
jgi:hypothetical protein